MSRREYVWFSPQSIEDLTTFPNGTTAADITYFPDVTDEDLYLLPVYLENLMIQYCPDIVHLKGLHHLKHLHKLDIDACEGVTQEAILELKKTLPNTIVKHWGFIDKNNQILNVEDPRDAFILMLLERIEYLEDRLNKVIEPKIEYLNQERLEFECQGSTISKNISKTFVIKLYHNSQSIDEIMSICELTIKVIKDKLGHKSILSISAIIETEAFEPDYALIYINMRRRCWVHETIKAISDVKIPCLIKVEKNICSAFNSYVGIDELSKGLIYNPYDLDGNPVLHPLWKEWTRSAKILN